MCGRFVLATPVEEIAEYFKAEESPAAQQLFEPSFNVAPTDNALGLGLGRIGERVLDVYRWGLVNSWSKDLSAGNRLFNARAELVATKPSFRSAFLSRRLVVIADGFYEWRKQDGARRQPFYLVRADGAPMAFAGLWELWRDPEGGDEAPWLRSCTIVTTDANDDVSPVHDRMPVVLEPDTLEAWLAIADDEAELTSLLRPSAPGTIIRRPVDRRVGNVQNNDPGLIEPVAVDEPQTLSG